MTIITGRTCKHCREYKDKSQFYKAKRYINELNSICISCEKLRRESRFEKNPDHIRELKRKSAKKQRSNNPEVFRKRNADYRKTHPLSENQKQDKKEYHKKWSLFNKKSIHDKNIEKYKNNKEYYKERAKKFRLSHLDEIREKDRIRSRNRTPDRLKTIEYAENRRAKKKAVGGKVSKQEWQEVLVKYNYTCLGCRKTGTPLEQDHIVPLNPGTHTINNLQPLCRSCNARKGRKTIDYRT